MKEQYMKHQGGSFIQAKYSKDIVKIAFQKQMNLSSIKQQSRKPNIPKPSLFSIKEEV